MIHYSLLNYLTMTTDIKNNKDSHMHLGSSINKTKLYIKNIMYINAHNISHKAIKITAGRHLIEQNVQFYDVLYNCGDKDAQNQTNEPINILCNDLKMCQKRYGVTIYRSNNCSLPLNTHSESFNALASIIYMIRSTAIDYILQQNIPLLDIAYAELLRKKRIDIEMMKNGKMCTIIKLGSKTENHINTQIYSIDEFSNLLKDHKYNKINTDFFYKANIVISFRCTVYRKYNKQYSIEEKQNDTHIPQSVPYNMMIGFVPYLKIIELCYNRASCIPVINTNTKTTMLDNILIL